MRDGGVDVGAILIENLIAIGNDIGPVDGEAGGHFPQCAANLSPRIVAAVAIVFADLDKQAGQPVDVAAQRFLLHG